MAEGFFKRVLPVLAVLLLAPWPVAYAYSYDGDMTGQNAVRVESAESSARPGWQVFSGTIGGVDTPGDLFYIDTTNSPADVSVTLYITNAEELIHCYRYLILKVGVYVQADTSQWNKADGRSEPVSDTFITLRNGQVSFTLAGSAKYKVTIDGGSFYATGAAESNLSPQFYLTVD